MVWLDYEATDWSTARMLFRMQTRLRSDLWDVADVRVVLGRTGVSVIGCSA